MLLLRRINMPAYSQKTLLLINTLGSQKYFLFNQFITSWRRLRKGPRSIWSACDSCEVVLSVSLTFDLARSKFNPNLCRTWTCALTAAVRSFSFNWLQSERVEGCYRSNGRQWKWETWTLQSKNTKQLMRYVQANKKIEKPANHATREHRFNEFSWYSSGQLLSKSPEMKSKSTTSTCFVGFARGTWM